MSACTFCTAAFSSSAPVSCVPASLSLTLSAEGFTVSGASPAVVLLSAGVSVSGAAAASASSCSCSSCSATETAPCCCSSCFATASVSCANAVMGSVEKQRINASNMLNTRFFIAFYLFPTGIVIPIVLKITYHTFSRQNHFLHESTQICHESTVGEIFRSIVTRDSRFVNGFLPQRKTHRRGCVSPGSIFYFLTTYLSSTL